LPATRIFSDFVLDFLSLNISLILFLIPSRQVNRAIL